jgi:outer membrane protein assembly factor BamD
MTRNCLENPRASRRAGFTGVTGRMGRIGRTSLTALVLAGALLAGCHGGKPKQDPVLQLSAEESLTQGKALLAKLKYASARPYFTHAYEVEPNSANGREALLLAADTYYLEGGSTDFVQAEAKYRDYLNRFPTSDQAAYVQFQIANSLAKRMERPDRDQAVTRKAYEAYEDLIRLYPTSEYAAQAQEQVEVVRTNLAEHEFIIGRFYMRYGSPRAAADRFEYLLKNFPRYPARDKVMYYMGIAYSQSSDPEDSQKAWERLKKEYPQSPYVAETTASKKAGGA